MKFIDRDTALVLGVLGLLLVVALSFYLVGVFRGWMDENFPDPYRHEMRPGLIETHESLED